MIQGRTKREPITAITIATMFSLGIAGAGTGITALSLQNQGFTSLWAAIDKDITCLEESISHLKKVADHPVQDGLAKPKRARSNFSATRGALHGPGEKKCCFYADHTGIIRKSMAKVKKRLAQRKGKQKAQQGWFEYWFQ